MCVQSCRHAFRTNLIIGLLLDAQAQPGGQLKEKLELLQQCVSGREFVDLLTLGRQCLVNLDESGATEKRIGCLSVCAVLCLLVYCSVCRM